MCQLVYSHMQMHFYCLPSFGGFLGFDTTQIYFNYFVRQVIKDFIFSMSFVADNYTLYVLYGGALKEQHSKAFKFWEECENLKERERLLVCSSCDIYLQGFTAVCKVLWSWSRDYKRSSRAHRNQGISLLVRSLNTEDNHTLPTSPNTYMNLLENISGMHFITIYNFFLIF